MCEIVCLIGMWKALGNMAEQKGRPAIWFQLMGVGLWFGGEITGRGRDGPRLRRLGPPPAQIRTCSTTAYGSYLG